MKYSPVKDEVNRRSGALKIPITNSLLEDAKSAHSRYKEFLERKKEENQRAERDRKEKEENKKAAAVQDQKAALDRERKELLSLISFTKRQTEEGSSRLKAALSSKDLVRSKILQAEEIINSSLKEKKNFMQT